MIIPFLMAVIPSLYLVYYFYRKDKRKPEPKGLIFKVFIWGILCTFPVIIVELIISTAETAFGEAALLQAFFKSFIVAALSEELFKFMVVIYAVYRKVEFDEVMDGIVYTVVASLGFACMENILYVLDGGLGVAIIRAFTAVPLHATASGLMGYYIGRAKFCNDVREEKRYFKLGLTVAILIHGFYDFLLFAAPETNAFLALGTLPLLWLAFRDLKRKMNMAVQQDMEEGRA